MIGGRFKPLPLEGGLDEVIPADELERGSEYGDTRCDAEETLIADPWRVVRVGMPPTPQPLRKGKNLCSGGAKVARTYVDTCVCTQAFTTRQNSAHQVVTCTDKQICSSAVLTQQAVKGCDSNFCEARGLHTQTGTQHRERIT